MVQGLNKEYIFNSNEEIMTYLEILFKYEKEYKLLIVAYCVMNNHVHLLINVEDVYELSKLMKNVNTTYAIYYNKKHNRCGFVFRNRYKSEEIFSEKHFISCINYIHNNPIKAGICKSREDYKYSSYNDYINKSGFVTQLLLEKCFIAQNLDYKKVLESRYECYNFIEENDEVDKMEIINVFLEEKNIGFSEIRDNGEMLKEIATILHFEYNITQKEIAEIIGVNRLKIHRILK